MLISSSFMHAMAFAPEGLSGSGKAAPGKSAPPEPTTPEPPAGDGLAALKVELAAAIAERDAARAELTDILEKTDRELNAMSKELDGMKAIAAKKAELESALAINGAPADARISNARAERVENVEMIASERGFYGSRLIAAGEKFMFTGIPGMWMVPATAPNAAEIAAEAKARNAGSYQGQNKVL